MAYYNDSMACVYVRVGRENRARGGRMAPAVVMQLSPAEGTKPEKQRKTWTIIRPSGWSDLGYLVTFV